MSARIYTCMTTEAETVTGNDEQSTDDGERRVRRHGVPMDIFTDSDIYRASQGSYRDGLAGMTMTLNLEAVAEVTREQLRENLDAMFDELYENALEELDLEQECVRHTPIPSSETVRVGEVAFQDDRVLTAEVETNDGVWVEIFEFEESELVERGTGNRLETAEVPVVGSMDRYEYVSDGQIAVETPHEEKDAVWYDSYHFEVAKRVEAASDN